MSKLLEQINSLLTAPERECRSLHVCCFCKKEIVLGQKYRDRGYGRRGHVDCVMSLARRIQRIGNDYHD